MNDQIEMLENSLRTNLTMARAMCKMKLSTLAKQYLNRAKKDKKLLDTYNKKWNLDVTKTITFG